MVTATMATMVPLPRDHPGPPDHPAALPPSGNHRGYRIATQSYLRSADPPPQLRVRRSPWTLGGRDARLRQPGVPGIAARDQCVFLPWAANAAVALTTTKLASTSRGVVQRRGRPGQPGEEAKRKVLVAVAAAAKAQNKHFGAAQTASRPPRNYAITAAIRDGSDQALVRVSPSSWSGFVMMRLQLPHFTSRTIGGALVAASLGGECLPISAGHLPRPGPLIARSARAQEKGQLRRSPASRPSVP